MLLLLPEHSESTQKVTLYVLKRFKKLDVLSVQRMFTNNIFYKLIRMLLEQILLAGWLVYCIFFFNNKFYLRSHILSQKHLMHI